MDKENIENQSPVGLSAVSGPSVGHTVEVPSSSLSEVGLGQKNEDRCGLGQENEDRCGLGASEIEEAGPRSRLKINIRGH